MKFDPLSFLTRADKWYLGGGNRVLYAPPFPLHRESPGLWDGASYYNITVAPLFTWALVTDDGRELASILESSTWQPDRWVRKFICGPKHDSVAVEERACVLPNDVALVSLTITNTTRTARKVRLIAWTAREHRPGGTAWVTAPDVTSGVLTLTQTHQVAGRPEVPIGMAFGCSGPSASWSLQLSEGVATLPHLSHTPFFEQLRNGRLSNASRVDGVAPDGLLWGAFEQWITLPARGSRSAAIGLAMAGDIAEARSALQTVLKQKDPALLSTLSWDDHFAGVPSFHCSDEYLTRAYWYRWYGLRLNTIFGQDGNYEYPAVCEGIGYFRAPISYSAPCHMLENRWMHEPELAQGSLLTFIHNQRDDGGFRGYIDPFHYRQEMFYHANWGRAVLALDAVHSSPDFLAEAYDGLKKYAAYFDKERDEEVSGLYDIDNHYETGQEFMHRYTAVDPNADRDNWGKVFRMKGVDVTVYIYELKRALAVMALRLGRSQDSDLWTLEADRTRDAVRNRMWNARDGMFYDIDPSTGAQTKVKAATCFYPYFTDIVDEDHLAGLKRHLLSPKEFWSAWPVPSTSMDDPTFSAEPLWKGKRMNCPWNGRVWPMTNSHIMEALATTALRFNDGTLEAKSAEFLTKFVRMLFFDQDPTRPNCFEHYNPITGQPSTYRGVDDYMHSWLNDLILKYVCGVQVGTATVTIRPLDFGLRSVDVENLIIRGRRMGVSIRGKRVTVRVEGRKAAEGTLGRPIVIR